jgi:predicted dehydrogenase
MHRRLFLQHAAAALAPSSRPIRIAFLGCAHSHAFDKSRVVRSLPHFELAGFHEPDPAVAGRFATSGLVSLPIERILTDPTIAAVAVESEVKRHAELALLALRAGKHVHVEKPPADTLDAFREIENTATSRRLILQVGYMTRYNPALELALDAARRGLLGDIHFVRGNFNTLIDKDRRPEWALFPGGQMFEQGCYIIDFIVRLLGRPAKISPFLRTHGPFADHLADNTLAVLEYPRALAVVQSSVLQSGAFPYRSIEIQGSRGTALIRPLEPPALELHLTEAAPPYDKGLNKVSLRPYSRYVDDFSHFAAAIRGESAFIVPPEQELVIHETLMACCSS